MEWEPVWGPPVLTTVAENAEDATGDDEDVDTVLKPALEAPSVEDDFLDADAATPMEVDEPGAAELVADESAPECPDESAEATPHPYIKAAPIPSAAANPPTRPT